MRKLLIAPLFLLASMASASNGPSLAQKVAERPSNDPRTGVISFATKNSKGQVRRRTARLAVTETGATHRMVLSFQKPVSIRETSFLTHDHKSPKAADETWLYLPATSRTRRIPSSGQSDSFMGTELTYGDVKDSFKFGLGDYKFTYGGKTKSGRHILKGKAVSAAKAKKLGYGGFVAHIDPATNFPRFISFTDPSGRKLKTVSVKKMQKVGSSWMATQFTVANSRTGRSTTVTISNLTRSGGLSGKLFDPKLLDRVASRMK